MKTNTPVRTQPTDRPRFFTRRGGWLRRMAGVVCLALLLAPGARAQLSWSSYNNVGTLVTANVATGGDATYGNSVTFTIPASTQLAFVTKTFASFSIPTSGNSKTVTFSILESGGGLGATSGRLFGYGLFSDSGTVSSDVGYFCLYNRATPGWEGYMRPSTDTKFFQTESANQFNVGKQNTGNPADGTMYSGQFQVNNSSGNIQMGTSSSTVSACGFIINGSGVTEQGDATTAKTPPNINQTSFNEFAVMFDNTTVSAVTLTLSSINLVPLNPVITTQPTPVSGSPGATATFSVALNANTDTSSLTYTWHKVVSSVDTVVGNGSTGNGSTFSGATTATLTLTSAQIADNANYYVALTNNYGTAISSQAQLNIASSATAPAISAISATNVVMIVSNSISVYSTNVTVTASGSPLPSYYWTNAAGLQLQGGSSATLTLSGLGVADAGLYSVTASNIAGQASTNFMVNVYVLPTISSQPTNLLLNLGDPANFSVTSTDGNPSPAYQWYKNGVAISGATATNYSIASVAYTDIAKYSVIISNIAGTVTSTNAILAINSPMTVSSTSPANGATGLCYDTPLAVTFSQAPAAGSTGKIRIYNTSNTTTPVDTLDMSQGSPQARTIGGVSINAYPILVSGNTAYIYPHSGVMTSNQSYYVTVDAGAIVDGNGAYFTGISSSSTWQFSTKAGGPFNTTNFVVAADGSGDFCTVQGACDAVPNANASRLLINIHSGTYTEIVRLNSKSDVTFIGQDRTNSLIQYPNWNGINGASSTRPLFGVLGANDVAVENLTISNSTPNATGNNQAEALYVNSSKRFIMLYCNLDSYQDTLLVNNLGDTAYLQDSHVQGNTDFTWGQGTIYQTNDEVMCMPFQSAQDYLTQARTPQFTNGFAYVNCRIVGANGGVNNCFLGRDGGGTSFPFGQVAYISCTMDTNVIVPAGWSLGSGTTLGQTTSLRFWEYQSVDLNGNPVNTSSRASWSQQINSTTAASVANVTNWLYGWQPQLAPYIVTQPANQTVSAGQTATFSVNAIGISAPTYQWQTNGVNMSGATSATLSILNVQRVLNGTTFAVIITNNAGAVTSSVVTLNYTGDAAPAASPATFTRASGLSLKIAVADLLTNATDADGDTLTLVGVGTDGYNLTTTNGTTLTTNSTFVFYTNSAPENVADQFNYVVADGFGGLGTNTVTINVVSVTGQLTSTPVLLTGTSATLQFYGIPGTNYDVERATNLTPPVNWVDLGTFAAPASGVFQVIDNFNDLGNTAPPQAYWQLIINP